MMRALPSQQETILFASSGIIMEVLQILNEPGVLLDAIQRVLATLKTRTGFDAVGLRLQDGEDFPYYAQQGFSADFLLTENSLLERGADGGVYRDKDGKVRLYCTCGLVISGKTDPAHPLFTRGGSFWTNDSFSLLDIPSDQDPRYSPRNQCIHQGYASMALIPIRDQERIVGLLHFNDQRKGRFCIATIELFESIAAHIGSALMRKRAEVEHEKLQAQFMHAQKMESVGRLAGGVAHDFNNMLTGIMGYAELCQENIAVDNPIHEFLDEIIATTKRSAKLTNHLLAFARKQIIEPKLLDINDTISGMLKLLTRLIGKDVIIKFLADSAPWLVKMDPTQIDQILANLCVNARDAISGVGSVIIETRNATVDTSYCGDHLGFVPGEYVLLTVTDTGCGMDRMTLEKIFDPFFTTKGIGEGTGLGLSTVFGIVKQNSGFINVTSELGKGTRFEIYLPRSVATDDGEVVAEMKAKALHGNETVMLVDDEKSIRVTTSLFLQGLGYTVLVAKDPEQALRLAAEYPGEIHLLITDVIMPGMSGCDLSNQLTELRPAIKSLFISGFTADVIAQRGISEDGINFLSKPFGRDVLGRKVRQVLDAGGTAAVVGVRESSS